MDITGGIYIIINNISIKCYIGQTINFKNRWRGHATSLRHGRGSCKHLQASWIKYGEGAFTFDVLENIPFNGNKEDYKKELKEAEQFWMDYFRFMGSVLYNSHPSAASPLGYRHSEGAKSLLSLHKKGVPFSEEHKKALSKAWLTRPPTSDVTKQKISDAGKLKTISQETKNKTAATLKGHIVSKETREKIADSLLGNIPWNKGLHMSESTKLKMSKFQKGRKSVNKTPKEIEDSIIFLLNTTNMKQSEIARNLNMPQSTMSCIVKRNRNLITRSSNN